MPQFSQSAFSALSFKYSTSFWRASTSLLNAAISPRACLCISCVSLSNVAVMLSKDAN